MNRFPGRAGMRWQIVRPGDVRGAGNRQVTAPRYLFQTGREGPRAFQFFRQNLIMFGQPQVIDKLEVKPELRCGAQDLCQQKSRFCCHPAPVVAQLIHSLAAERSSGWICSELPWIRSGRHGPARFERWRSLTANGRARWPLKTPYRHGTTRVIFEPLDFIARPAARAPRPQINPGRFK